MMKNIKKLVKRIFNRLSITIKDYYIDYSIQNRLIGDRRANSLNTVSGIHQWHNTSYDAFSEIFFKSKLVQIKKSDIIVDVGCADGKLFNYLLFKGVKNRMIGYEINKSAGLITKKKLSKYPNVEIILENIFDNFPANATLFYLFNPFGEEMMCRFIEQIKRKRDDKPAIVYNYPLFAHLFDPKIFNISIIQMHQYKHAEGKIAIIGFKD